MFLFWILAGLLIALCVFLCVSFAKEGETKDEEERRIEALTKGTVVVGFPLPNHR